MRINADFGQPIAVDTAALPWVPSPLAGVDRRMLDRIGGEVARATSLVRYAPGSFFDAHTHGGGEEFFVLDGVFSDEHADYGPGAYVRNPVGSRHTPFSRAGCTIFVKLWQMSPKDQEFVRIDTGKAEWTRQTDEISTLTLAERTQERVRLVRLAPGADYAIAGQDGGAELLMLSGLALLDAEALPRAAWVRLPPGHTAHLGARATATFYLKTGHLAVAPEAPA